MEANAERGQSAELKPANNASCSAGANFVILEGMERAPTIPTLEQLRRGHPWCWVVCERCLHRRPVAFVPFIIRWGPDASSDILRRSARCTNTAPELGGHGPRLGAVSALTLVDPQRSSGLIQDAMLDF